MATVVLAEDDGDIRDIASRLLSRAGHTVVQAPDGAAAWATIDRDPPDAVVTDIEMPGLTGVELCLRIRADDRFRTMPVVFIGGSLIPGDPRPAQAQATAALRKPFLAPELIACVQRAIENGHTPGQEPVVG